MTVPDRLRLPLTFDATALAAEADRLPADAWVQHFNRAIYEGEWTGVALRSVGGKPTQLYPDPAATEPFADTVTLDQCPAHRAAVARFECPVMAARLLRLGPGAVLKEHSDLRLRWADGEVRLHIPIQTAPGVEFQLDGKEVEMAAGEAWYLDLTLPHQAANRSPVPRIHLVVDCVVDPWLTALLEGAYAGGNR